MTTDTGKILDIDGNIYVKQRREFKIIGILKIPTLSNIQFMAIVSS